MVHPAKAYFFPSQGSRVLTHLANPRVRFNGMKLKYYVSVFKQSQPMNRENRCAR